MGSGSGWILWVWLAQGRCGLESLGVTSVYGCKEVYRFTHITYPYLLLLNLLFFAAPSPLFVHFVKSFLLLLGYFV